MTLEEFGKSIKSKYPQYENIDDIALAQRVLEKYPQYSNRITKEERKIESFKEKPSQGFLDLFRQTKVGKGIQSLSQVGKMAKEALPEEGPASLARYLVPSSETEVISQFLLPLALKAIGGVGRAGIKSVGTLLPKVKLQAVERLIERGGNVLPFFKGIDKEEVGNFLTSQAQKLKSLRDIAGEKVSKTISLAQSKVGAKPVIDLSKDVLNAENLIKDELGLITEGSIERSKAFGNPSVTKKVLNLVNELKSSPLMTPLRSWQIRQEINNLRDFVVEETGQELKSISVKGDHILRGLSESIKNQLKNITPEIDPVFKEFSDKATAYTILRKNLFSGTPEQKVLGLFRKGSKVNRALVKAEERLKPEERFGEKLKDVVARQEFQEIQPRFSPTGLTTGLGLLALKNIPAAVATTGLSSPRIFGLATRAGVEAGKLAGKAAPFSLQALLSLLR